MGLRKLLWKLLPDPDRRGKLTPSLRERLQKAGVGESAFAWLLHPKSWTEFSLGEKEESLLKEDYILYLWVGLEDYVLPLFFDLLDMKRQASALLLLRKLLEGFGDPSEEVRKRLMAFRDEAFEKLIAIKLYHNLTEMLEGTHPEGLFAALRLDLFDSLIQDFKTSRQDGGADDLLAALGEGVLPRLIDLLESAEFLKLDPLDSFRLKKRLFAIFKKIPRASLEIAKRLHTVKDEEGVLHLLGALREIGGSEIVPFLSGPLRHADPEVRRMTEALLRKVAS